MRALIVVVDAKLIFQDPASSLDPRERIGPTLREPMLIQRIGTEPQRADRIAELLHEVGLAQSLVSVYPHELSGGQRQRIAFARALTLEPHLIVADEPVSALDVSVRSQVLNLMRRIQASRDLAYVLISHDLAAVRYLADRVGVMYLGKLVEIGPSHDIYTDPAHPYTASLLGSIPALDPARARAVTVIKGELPSPTDPPSGRRFRTRCPLAQEICALAEPALEMIRSAQHSVACHFPLAHNPSGRTQNGI